MCDVNAYITKDGSETLLLESITLLRPQPGGTVYMKNLFGEERTVQAQVVEVSFSKNKVLLAAT